MIISKNLVQSSSERIFLAAYGRGCRDEQKDIMWRESKLEVSMVFLPSELREPQNREKKYCKSQRGWRTQGEEDPLNQLSWPHMGSQRLKKKAQVLHESSIDPLVICHGSYLDVFEGHLAVGSGCASDSSSSS